MHNFLTGHAYREAIKEQIQRSNTIKAAVAFWGKESECLLKPKDTSKIQILCDVSMGASNADVIEAIQSRIGPTRIKKVNSFHAKVWIFDNTMILGSANASTLALGPIREETTSNQLKHIEFGVLIQDPTAVAEAKIWFRQLFNDPAKSSEISDSDLEVLRERNHALRDYERGSSTRTLTVFLDELRSGNVVPFISWWDKDDKVLQGDKNKTSQPDQVQNRWNKTAAWVEEFDKEAVQSQLKKSPFWIVHFVAERYGRGIRPNPTQAEDAIAILIERMDADLSKSEGGSEFYLAGSSGEQQISRSLPDQVFWEAFRVVLARNPEVGDLLDIGHGSWSEKLERWDKKGFLTRQFENRDLIARFWQDVMKVYDNSSGRS